MNIFDKTGLILCISLAFACFFVGAGFGSGMKSDEISENCEKAGVFIKNSKAYECQPRAKP